jgi:hypothetical protein
MRRLSRLTVNDLLVVIASRSLELSERSEIPKRELVDYSTWNS